MILGEFVPTKDFYIFKHRNYKKKQLKEKSLRLNIQVKNVFNDLLINIMHEIINKTDITTENVLQEN